MQEVFHTVESYAPCLGLNRKQGRPRGPNYRPRVTGRGRHRGERTGNAVLTEALVLRIREIRAIHGLGAIGISRVMAAGGHVVSPSAIQEVIGGKNWKHVQLPPDWEQDRVDGPP